MKLRKLLQFGAPFAALFAGGVPASAQPSSGQQETDRADAGMIERDAAAPAAPNAAPAAKAVPPADAPSAELAGEIMVGAVVIDGARAMRPAQFAPVFAPFVGRRLGAADLKALAQAVADLARAQGYVFASAWVPRQTVESGVLRVRLDEGAIGDVRISGADNIAIGRTLAVLADARPVTKSTLERALLLAGDLPGVRVADTRYLREGDRGILLVEASERRSAGSVQVDNWGSRAVGPIRVRVRADLNGAFLAGDQLSLRSTVTPLQPRELATVGFDYAIDTGFDGLLAGFGASFASVEPGRQSRLVEIDGRSVSFNANLSYPLLRRREANVWTTADFTVRDVEQERADALIRNDRLSTVTLGVSGYRELGGGWLYGRLSARQGLGLFDSTRRGDPLASRFNGSARFSKLDVYADWTGPLSEPLSLRVAGEAQVASRALLSSEEMGLGGPRFGRAYDYNERSGDRGVAGLAELRYDLKSFPKAIRSTQLYVFADAGSIGNLGRGGRGGNLYSAGGGVRFDLSRVFDAGAEIAFPLAHDRYETGDRDPRLSFTLSARF
jgi:hemolysin activation/secretion protein